MAWERYITRTNTILFSVAALGSSWYAVQYRHAQNERRQKGTFHVAPARSGGGI